MLLKHHLHVLRIQPRLFCNFLESFSGLEDSKQKIQKGPSRFTEPETYIIRYCCTHTRTCHFAPPCNLWCDTCEESSQSAAALHASASFSSSSSGSKCRKSNRRTTPGSDDETEIAERHKMAEWDRNRNFHRNEEANVGLELGIADERKQCVDGCPTRNCATFETI